ncbi:MAG: hypothetical protein V4463_05240 [Pseudomonadota bacterium]
MADQTYSVLSGVMKRLRDMLNGTFAEVVFVDKRRAGLSANTNIGVSSAQIIAAGAFIEQVMVQNTHATQSMYVSFNDPATVADFQILPGGSVAYAFGPTNALFAIGSGVSTTYAITGA